MAGFLKRNRKKSLLALLLFLLRGHEEKGPLLAILIMLSFVFVGPSVLRLQGAWLEQVGRRLGIHADLWDGREASDSDGSLGTREASRPKAGFGAGGLFGPGQAGFDRYGRSTVGLVAGGKDLVGRRKAGGRPGPEADAESEEAESGAEGGFDEAGEDYGKTIGGILRPAESRKLKNGVTLSEEEMEQGLSEQRIAEVIQRGLSGEGLAKLRDRLNPRGGSGVGASDLAGLARFADGSEGAVQRNAGAWRSGSNSSGSTPARDQHGAGGSAREGGGSLLAKQARGGDGTHGGDLSPLRDGLAAGGAGFGGPSGKAMPPFTARASDRASEMMRGAYSGVRMPSASGASPDGLSGGTLSGWKKGRLSNAFEEQPVGITGGAGPNTVMYELAETRAYSISAAPPPGLCVPGACPAEFASNTGGVVFDGGRLKGGIVNYEEFGDPGVNLPDQGQVNLLIAQARKSEEDAMKCEQAEATYGGEERTQMAEIQRLADKFDTLGCNSGGCSKSKYKRCKKVGNQMRAVCRNYNRVASQKAAACPLMNTYSAMDCNK